MNHGSGKALFFVHKGNQDYFNVCLEYARRRNPGLPFVVIDNVPVDFGDPDTTFFSTDDFESPLDSTYVHLSPNGYQFELLCLSRWFYVLQAMQRLDISRAGHVDSDVLIGDVSDRLEADGFEFTFDSGHMSFFSQEQLSSLCGFIERSYASEEARADLERIRALRKRDGLLGGVSDMTLIRWFVLGPLAGGARDLSMTDGVRVYDHNVNLTDGYYLMHEGRKAIVGDGEDLYFIDSTTFLPIEARGIHFQGAAKQFMATVAKGPGACGEKALYSYSRMAWVPYDGTVSAKVPRRMRARELAYRVDKKTKSLKSMGR